MENQTRQMDAAAVATIKVFGGTTALSDLIDAPVSTVQSWKYIGIPTSRMAHIRLVAQMQGKVLPEAEAA